MAKVARYCFILVLGLTFWLALRNAHALRHTGFMDGYTLWGLLAWLAAIEAGRQLGKVRGYA